MRYNDWCNSGCLEICIFSIIDYYSSEAISAYLGIVHGSQHHMLQNLQHQNAILGGMVWIVQYQLKKKTLLVMTAS